MATTKYLKTEEWKILERLLMPQNAKIVEVMLATGLRVSDVLALTPGKFSTKNRKFTVYEKKTGKARRVYIPAKLHVSLLSGAGKNWVFENPATGKPYTRQGVYKDIKRAATAMRLQGTVACHSARKTYAVEMYRRTGSVQAVQSDLRHDNVLTTIQYLLGEFSNKISSDGGDPPTAGGA
jgi:integrase